MMKRNFSPKLGLSWALLIWAGGICVAQDTLERPIYVFNAFDARAKAKWGLAPVISAGRWGLKAETTQGIKRFSYTGDFRFSPSTASDRQIVAVETFEMSLGDARRNELEAEPWRTCRNLRPRPILPF
jgi:hypothetical protein